MITTSTNAEQRTLLQNISWETFESLLKETGEDRNSRFAYDCGTLEIMTPLYEHESYKIQFDRLIFTLAEELDVGIKSAGSMTLKREIVNRGIEPDNCYYIQNEPAVRNKKEFNLETDPPPDLAIEIDITSSSINKLGIYAALGVSELWIYDGQVLKFYQLTREKYVEGEFSCVFPLVSVTQMNGFIEQSQKTGEIALLKSFRAWVRDKITILGQ
ncbi:MAG: Uma2 family endonuclease [Kastovskya adunca ATA6-11-RM4]|jgi:Uma2 family endonuclease|nr:Uma2 family endonuclease [Kastovskya adunca ATA6-11-RM4]